MQIKPYVRKANFYETDAMGIVHHSNYIRWFEEARVDFMEQMGFGYEKSIEMGVDIAVVEVDCIYKSMVRFGETVQVRAFIREINPVKMIVGYEITDAKSGAVRTTGHSVHCFLDHHTHELRRLNRTIPELYELFRANTQQE